MHTCVHVCVSLSSHFSASGSCHITSGPVAQMAFTVRAERRSRAGRRLKPERFGDDVHSHRSKYVRRRADCSGTLSDSGSLPRKHILVSYSFRLNGRRRQVRTAVFCCAQSRSLRLSAICQPDAAGPSRLQRNN